MYLTNYQFKKGAESGLTYTWIWISLNLIYCMLCGTNRLSLELFKVFNAYSNRACIFLVSYLMSWLAGVLFKTTQNMSFSDVELCQQTLAASFSPWECITPVWFAFHLSVPSHFSKLLCGVDLLCWYTNLLHCLHLYSIFHWNKETSTFFQGYYLYIVQY